MGILCERSVCLVDRSARVHSDGGSHESMGRQLRFPVVQVSRILSGVHDYPHLPVMCLYELAVLHVVPHWFDWSGRCL